MIKLLIYESLKRYVRLALRFYFKKIEVHFEMPLPHNRPIIFAVNHQNAFLDAIIVAVSSHRSPHFLTRASVFNSSVARFFLDILKMMPIYRFRDGIGNVKKNDQIIENCVKLLNKNQSVLIFPEGNHDLKWGLRPLQKGAARIAFEAEKKADYKLSGLIVPVGLQYSHHTRSRGNVLVNFGSPIEVKDFVPAFQEDTKKGILQLTRAISKGLTKLIVNIQPLSHYEEIKEKWLKSRSQQGNLKNQLLHDQELVKALSEKAQKGENGNSSITLNKENRNRNWYLWPIAIYGWINHLIPNFFMRLIINKFVKDPHFHGSIKLAGGIFMYPVFYLIQAAFLWYFTGNWLWGIIYLFSLPITGAISLDFFQRK